MKYKAFCGRIIKADLTERTVGMLPVSSTLADNFLGGTGIAARMLAGLAPPDTDPLAEDNPLVFMTGPLTGTVVPWSGRHCVASLSPLTGLWGEAYAGGSWARELKRAGFDGIVITGRADRPVYIHITDRGVSIEDAAFLKEKDTCQTETLLRSACGRKTKVAAIGKAGENHVRFASIIHDGAAARTAARCGLGAVMGSKNLKALAVQGTGQVELADRRGLLAAIKAVMPELINTAEHRIGKARGVFSFFADDGRPGVNNFRDAELPGFRQALLTEIERHIRQTEPYMCAGCPTGCVESNVSAGARQTHWEALGPLGPQCGISDMRCVQQAFDVCNRHGIDTISAGGAVSLAMECFEAGLITERDTDGIRLVFGNGEGLLAMLEKICSREGFGAVLAEGTRRAARQIGRGAEKFAMEVKGLEVPAHDPRCHNFLALAYATDNRGAIHTGAADPKVEGFDLMDMDRVRFAVDGTARTVARGQDYGGIINSLVLCAFSHAGYAQYNSAPGFPGITARDVIGWLRYAGGIETDFESLLQIGERIFTLKHLINLRQGLDPALDTLPERLTTLPKRHGPAAAHLPPVQALVADYCRIRGWQADGSVAAEKLQELGLQGPDIFSPL